MIFRDFCLLLDLIFHAFHRVLQIDPGCDRLAFPCFHVYYLVVPAVGEIVVLAFFDLVVKKNRLLTLPSCDPVHRYVREL